MKQIQLTQGKIALVDDEDYDWLSQRKWQAQRGRHTFYAKRGTGGRYNRKTELMHRLIFGLQPGDKRQCDHRDKNGLNNQRSNLRRCTNQQNSQSQRKRNIGSSKYKGVCWDCNRLKWHSSIYLRGKHIYLGRFHLEIDAARAYDVAAAKHHGKFALTNKMLGLL